MKAYILRIIYFLTNLITDVKAFVIKFVWNQIIIRVYAFINLVYKQKAIAFKISMVNVQTVSNLFIKKLIVNL